MQTEPSIAIIPFENLTDNQNMQLLCEGFTYDLIMELSRFKQFQIRYLNSQLNNVVGPDEADPSLKTDYIIRGSFSVLRNQVRINAQLIESKDNRLVWADRIEDKMDSLDSIQNLLLQRLVASLQQQLDTDLIAGLRKRQHVDLITYQYWLYGMHELKKGTLETDEIARDYFTKALENDPQYSLAYSGMSLTYFNEWSCQLWDRWDLSQKGAKEWAEKALQIDDQNYIANLIIGKIYLFERAFDKSEMFLRKALRLNPNDPFNLIQIASAFVFLDLLDEAEEFYEKSLKINPLQEDLYHPYGALIAFEKGDFDKTIRLGEKYLRMAWVDYSVLIGAAWFYKGERKKALEFWKMYIGEFQSKISRDKYSSDQDALEWAMLVNPYKGKSRFIEFWKFIASGMENPLNLNKALNVETTGGPVFKNRFVKNGEVWSVDFQNITIRIPDSKGLRDIAQLLSEPYKQFYCFELMGSGLFENPTQIIDDRARKEYQKRQKNIMILLLLKSYTMSTIS